MKQVASYGMAFEKAFLLSNLGNLARKYPPARQALEKRREEVQSQLSANGADVSVARELANLNHYMGEDQKTLAYFDKLPADSPQRAAMGYNIFDLLLSAKRYHDAVSASPYPQYTRLLLMTTQVPGQLPADAVASLREYEVTSAAKELEALAGAGQLDDARDLIKNVLAFDKSDKTVATLREHLATAGHPELFP